MHVLLRNLLCVLAVLSLSGCRARLEQREAAHVADSLTPEQRQKLAAWYLLDTATQDIMKEMITICIDESSDYLKVDTETRKKTLYQAIGKSFSKWLVYLDDRLAEIDPDSPNRQGFLRHRFPRGIKPQKCTPDTDLVFVFGNVPAAYQGAIGASQDSLYGLAVKNRPQSVGARQNWGKGLIWVAPHTDTFSAGDSRLKTHINYNHDTALNAVLLHEFGHVFGNRHVDGTIMDTTLLDKILENLNQLTRLDGLINWQDEVVFDRTTLATIDWTRGLLFCGLCRQRSWTMKGVDAFEQNLNVKFTFGDEHLTWTDEKTGEVNELFYSEQQITDHQELFIRDVPLKYPLVHQTRIYKDKEVPNVAHSFEWNAGPIYQTSPRLRVACGANKPMTLFAPQIMDFVGHTWDNTTYDFFDQRSQDEWVANFRCMQSPEESITAWKHTQDRLVQGLQASRAAPAPSVQFIKRESNTALRGVIIDRIKATSEGGCQTVNIGSVARPFCFTKIAAIPFIFSWGSETHWVSAMQEILSARQRLTGGYRQAFRTGVKLMINGREELYLVRLETETMESGGQKQTKLLNLQFFDNQNKHFKYLIADPITLSYDAAYLDSLR